MAETERRPAGRSDGRIGWIFKIGWIFLVICVHPSNPDNLRSIINYKLKIVNYKLILCLKAILKPLFVFC
jgi:hypothetical protein